MNTTLNKHMEHLQLDDSLDKTREKIDFLNPIRNTHSIIQNEFDRLNLALGAIKAPQLELSSKLQATNFTSEMIKTTSEAINHGWLHSTASLRELSSSKLIATLSALGDTDSYKALSTSSIGVEFLKIHEQSLAYSSMTKVLALEHLNYDISDTVKKAIDSLDLHNKTSVLASITPSLLSEHFQEVFNSFTAVSALSKIGADFAQFNKKILANIGSNSLENLSYPRFSTALEAPSWLAEITAQANATSLMLKELESHYQLPLTTFDFVQNTFLAQMDSLSQVDWRTFAVEYDFDSEETKQRLQGMSMSIHKQNTLQDITATALSHLAQLPPKAQEAILAYVLIPFFQMIKWFIFKSIDSIPGAIVGCLIGITLTGALQQQPIIINSISPQERSKHIRQTAIDLVDAPELLAEFRFVIAAELEVRFNPKSRSPILGILEYGSPVRAIKRRGAFTLINWVDDNGESQLTGWVYSRYLRKFI